MLGVKRFVRCDRGYMLGVEGFVRCDRGVLEVKGFVRCDRRICVRSKRGCTL